MVLASNPESRFKKTQSVYPILIILHITNKIMPDTHCYAFRQFLNQYSTIDGKFYRDIESLITCSFKTFGDESIVFPSSSCKPRHTTNFI